MQNIPRLSAIIEQLKLRKEIIASVELAVGELILYSDEEIHSMWNESSLARSMLTIRRVPAEHQCMLCFEKYHPLDKKTACPYCGGVGAKVIAGEEFRLLSINGERK